MHTILAADIGGTNSRFARFFLNDAGRLEMGDSVWLGSWDVKTFAEQLDALAATAPELAPDKADATVIAVAGPVERGSYSDPPNIPWDVDMDLASRTWSMGRFALINDFVSQAHACLTPAVADADIILPGTPDPDYAIAVIGAGTGLGKCTLMPVHTPGGRRHVAIPSEGGHSDIPFLDEEEFRFGQFVRERTGRFVVGDLVITGPGLKLLHEFLTGDELPPREIGALIDQGMADATLEWFARFYGRSCKNYVLENLAMGGVFLSGGVTAKCPSLARHEAFAKAFTANDTHGRYLARVPVRLNANEDSGLWGSAAYAAQMLF